jgi:hypothetical protein
MEETTKKKIIVIGADTPANANRLLAADNLDVEFVDDLKEIGKPYKQVLEEMPPYELTCLKQGYECLYPPVPKKLQGLEVKHVRNSKTDPKHGRNEPCPCGSGKKYKRCCFVCS